MSVRPRRYPLALAAIFGVCWLALAIQPFDRKTWLLESALAVAAVAALIGLYRRLPFSRVSYTLIFVFLCLHTLGAHYTYSEVPYDAWFAGWTGRSLNGLVGWERNNFDRVIHSLRAAARLPVRDLSPRGPVRGFWGCLPLDVTMSTSMLTG
jgi:putative membrane protein